MNASNKVFNELKAKGFRPRSYTDNKGNSCIGYGHIITPGDGVAPTEIINNFKASLLLLNDVQKIAEQLVPVVPNNISQEEFDALVIDKYNSREH